MSARDLSSEEIDIALAAFAVEGGREKQTQKLLRAAKVKVSMSTLRNWAYNVHKERYQRISHEVEKEVRVKMADTYQRLAETSAELSEEALARIKALLTKRDAELAETEGRLTDTEDELRTTAAAIDATQGRLATELEIPNVDALIEEVLGERGQEADSELVAELAQLYKRREGLASEVQALSKRRDQIEVSFKDLTRVLREAGVMGGIAIDKVEKLNDRPAQRIAIDLGGTLRGLREAGLEVIEGEAAEEVPALPVSTNGHSPTKGTGE